MKYKTRFHIPFKTSESKKNIINLLINKKKSLFGLDFFTKINKKIIEDKFKFKNIHFTNSCTSALEMSALLTWRKYKNEVLLPSYTFVSTASSFVRAGFSLKFLDVCSEAMLVSFDEIKKNVTSKTGVIVIVHYAGTGVEDIDKIKKFCKKKNIYLVEDAAQCLGSFYKNKILGSYGDLSCFSFHETKNIHCGSGGMLVVNNKKFIRNSHFILERGTDRRLVIKNQKKKYSWVTIGSSFNMTELNSAYLTAQLKSHKRVLKIREKLFKKYIYYFKKFNLESFFYTNINYKYIYNFHCLFIVLNKKTNTELINFLKEKKIQAFIGYAPLHSSPFGKKLFKRAKLKNTDIFSKRIVRLPLHTYLKEIEIKHICFQLKKYFYKN